MKQYAIIGLGNFGSYLATRLYEKNHDVLAIDKKSAVVQEIRDYVSQAVVADIADPKAAAELGLEDMDVVIVCIGSVLSNSILATLNLIDLGISEIYAMAISEAHGRILNKIGVHKVFFPEKDTAFSLADRLNNPNVIDYLPFMEGYSIIELSPPASFLNKALKDLNLINKYGVQILAIKEFVTEKMMMIPTANYVVNEGDILFVLGPLTALEELKEDE
ncbi:TrkA family potassium uptake protein [Desulfobacterales bacterium HSG16]|nr:TrkA family potassium uptake protein [Desulfobacterales bacterium HSG16]